MLETMAEGFNVGYEIKKNPEYQSIPIILISAIDKHTGFPVEIEFIKANEFLEKPINPKTLLKCIEKLL